MVHPSAHHSVNQSDSSASSSQSVLTIPISDNTGGYSANVTFRHQQGTGSNSKHHKLLPYLPLVCVFSLIIPTMIANYDYVGSGFDRKSRRRASSIFSSDSARKKWKIMEKKVMDMLRTVLSTAILSFPYPRSLMQ